LIFLQIFSAKVDESQWSTVWHNGGSQTNFGGSAILDAGSDILINILFINFFFNHQFFYIQNKKLM
jgi:hypothetical protein